MSKSLDPRVNRADFADPKTVFEPENELEQWQTYQVFQQIARGGHHQHVGIVHAPNAEMAILFAKEQYARRGKCVSLWVVRTEDVFQTGYEDEEMFEFATDKNYREASGYKTRDVISEFKKRQGSTAQSNDNEVKTVSKNENISSGGKTKVILRKK